MGLIFGTGGPSDRCSMELVVELWDGFEILRCLPVVVVGLKEGGANE